MQTNIYFFPFQFVLSVKVNLNADAFHVVMGVDPIIPCVTQEYEK